MSTSGLPAVVDYAARFSDGVSEKGARLIDSRAREISSTTGCEDCAEWPPGKCPICFVKRLIAGRRACGICGGPRDNGLLTARYQGKSFPICWNCKQIPANIRANMPPQFVAPTWRDAS